MTLTTRLAIAMIVLVAIAVSAVGWLSYRNLEQALLPRVLDRIETHSRLVAADLESYVRQRDAAISRAFDSAAALNGLIRARLAGGIDPIDGVSEKTWRDRIAVAFCGANSKPNPPMRSSGSSASMTAGAKSSASIAPARTERFGIVPEAELQRKGDATYFKETIRLAAGRNIRLAAQSRSRTTGIIEDAAQADAARRDAGLRARRQAVRHRHHQCRHAAGARPRPVIGAAGRDDLCRQPARGDYLVHPDRSREFGSQLGKPDRLAEATSRIWQRRSARPASAAPRSYRTRPDGRTASRLLPPFWPAPNGSRSSRPFRTR